MQPPRGAGGGGDISQLKVVVGRLPEQSWRPVFKGKSSVVVLLPLPACFTKTCVYICVKILLGDNLNFVMLTFVIICCYLHDKYLPASPTWRGWDSSVLETDQELTYVLWTVYIV